ncbi:MULTISPECIES: FUSC family protein [unclassified Rhodococcus (in: high G+C Gram-positive bacteria)]|uniref:FUSC family protein n=1 Tax=unclassified Rhodococcus (in: high G+C Gram-positive bacteria) TaxID=192944 RepID=UPI0012E85BC1|nr:MULTISPECIES: FUSC family protein [unclassified Rhodococcus (in: high G+C Gram-positive bacteria)]
MTLPEHRPPPPPRGLRVLFGLPAVGRRWPGGLRSALAFGIPAIAAWVLGFHTEALLVVSGSFAVIYGEGRPFRSRWWVVLTAGGALVASVWLGATAGQVALDLGSTGWAQMIPVTLLSLLALVAVYVIAALRLGPPGAFFFVLVCAVSSYIPGAGIGAVHGAVCAAIGVASALLVSMSGVLWDPRGPEREAVGAAVGAIEKYTSSPTPSAADRHVAAARLHAAWAAVYDAGAARLSSRPVLVQRLFDAHRAFAATTSRGMDADQAVDSVPDQLPLARPSIAYRLRRSLHRDSHASSTAIRVFCAAAAAGGISVALDLSRPDWAILGAVLVLQQGPDRVHGTYRGLQRLGGTLAGVALFSAIFLSPLTGLAVIVVLMVLQFAIEVSVARNYGLAVTFITPLALLMGTLTHPGAVLEDIVVDRIVETTVGVALAFAALWLLLPGAFRRALQWSDGRVLTLSADLLTVLRTEDVAGSSALTARRDVQFELVGSALAGAEAAHNDRRWAHRVWSQHAEVDRLGYELLAHCWTITAVGRMNDIGHWQRRVDAATAEFHSSTLG